ncbi:hypothetical protein HII36_39660 [Nonomuraea sp. NN258]|uniref:hypothetical protein n=1 Tax=Nonomuraea antri TaxID=2730852 RepID=UPI00156935AB|nr:hypothetical protein [Nonomuraea antri]NRQ37905.1 hypothetical protein [Nonomuraea antri]
MRGLVGGQDEAFSAVFEVWEPAVGSEMRARILACKDAPQLGTWIRRAAATAYSIDETFG